MNVEFENIKEKVKMKRKRTSVCGGVLNKSSNYNVFFVLYITLFCVCVLQISSINGTSSYSRRRSR